MLDANALLDLYRVTSATRKAVFTVLGLAGDRLWVPHQAALEFSRNRLPALTSYMAQFGEIKKRLNAAPEEAARLILKAVSIMEGLRARSMTSRPWTASDHGLEPDALKEMLKSLLAPALKELSELQSEHDIQPADLKDSDAVLEEIDSILEGKIGNPFNPAELRQLVEEAIEFRFPSKIPPGYLDLNDKDTPLRQAGDFILWRQVIQHVASQDEHPNVLIVTRDQKADWWQIDAKGRASGARQELCQEMLEHAGASLRLATLADFVDGANEHLGRSVGTQAAEELRLVVDMQGQGQSDLTTEVVDLGEIDYAQFERLIGRLLSEMGYGVADSPSVGQYRFDYVVFHRSDPARGIITVEAKKLTPDSTVPLDSLRKFAAMSDAVGAERLLFFTTARLGLRGKEIARKLKIEVIEGPMLVLMLERHLGVVAVLPSDEW